MLLSISAPCKLMQGMRALLLLQGPRSYQSHISAGRGHVLACPGLIFHRTLDYIGDWGGRESIEVFKSISKASRRDSRSWSPSGALQGDFRYKPWMQS
jgi:hypothetical protein